MNILGDNASNAEVTLLIENGIDLHSYQPSVSAVATISSCDLFVYGGGPSDDWVKDALKNATNSNMATVNMIEALGPSAKTEVLKEGMQEENSAHDEASEVDEHVWLSLNNAQVLVNTLTTQLSTLDSANAEFYGSNALAYNEKLANLDEKYRAAVQEAQFNTLIFADRFPFRYLVDDYHIDYYAAFPGCSAETEASFDTVIFLANKVDELGLNSVIAIEDSDQSLAQTVINNTRTKDQEIVVFDSIQSVTHLEVESGATYLSIMEDNLNALTKALY